MATLHDQRASRCAIAVMGKASMPGRVKTRLVPPLGAGDAADLNTAFLQDMVGNVILAARDAPISPYVAFSPAGAEDFFREHLPTEVDLINCSEPHFGANLFRAVDTLLARGHAAACVLNSDSPTLPTRLLVDAARELALPGDRVIIGPTLDGGYYLLGVKQAHARLFEDIAWSTGRVFQQTCERAAQLGLVVKTLDRWYDVDDAAALMRLGSELPACALGSSRDGLYWAPHTRSVWTRLAGSPPAAAGSDVGRTSTP